MYIVLIVDLALFFIVWMILGRFTLIWTVRPITVIESLLAGFAAWIFVLTVLLWFVGIIFSLIDLFHAKDTSNIWTLVFAALITGYFIDFLVRSKSELGVDDTIEFIKEALQFQRSAQHRLTILEMIQFRRDRQHIAVRQNIPDALERAQLQTTIHQGLEIKGHLTLLQDGKSIELTDSWHSIPVKYASHPFYEFLQEIKIDPTRKRLMLVLNLIEYNQENLQDDTLVLKLYRQVYDFLQLINNDPRLKPYSQFINSIFLLCRRKKIDSSGEEFYFPFLKVGTLVNDLKKLEGTYFNPRKLDTIAAVAFNNDQQV